MRRSLIVGLLFAILSTPALPQPDTVTVQQDPGLPGLWKIPVPLSGGAGVGLAGDHFGAMANLFCRIAPGMEIYCVNGGWARGGTASVEGSKVHIAWGTMMLRFVIDGALTADTVTGTFAVKLAGISHNAPDISVSTRLAIPQDNAPGQSPYLAALVGQLAANAVTTPYDAKAIVKNIGTLPNDIRKLGSIEAIAYLGTSPILVIQPDSALYRVYLVEFANGERLCGLHQRDDGVLDAFRCV